MTSATLPHIKKFSTINFKINQDQIVERKFNSKMEVQFSKIVIKIFYPPILKENLIRFENGKQKYNFQELCHIITDINN